MIRNTRQVVLSSMTLALALGAGCAQHGRYTNKALEEGHIKMSAMKSGVEWQMALEQFLGGELAKATRSIENAIALNPEVAKSHVLRGRIMIERGELESARASLARAEEIDPRCVDAQYYLGIVHERFSQPQEAVTRYMAAVQIDPTNAQYIVAAGEMLVQLKRLDDAEKLLNQPHESLKHNAAIRQTAGHIALLRGEPVKAVELLKQARLLAPDDLSVVEDLVRGQMSAKDYADAEFNITVLLRDKHNTARRDLLHWQAECLAAINRLTDARAILDGLVADEQGKSDVQTWVALGNVAAALGDHNRLNQASQRLMALAPSRQEGYVMRAMYLRNTGELTGALAVVDRAIAIDGEAQTPQMLRALIVQEMTKAGKSISALRRLTPRYDRPLTPARTDC